MAIIECPHCHLTISPFPNGECPACHNDVRLPPDQVGNKIERQRLTCPFCQKPMRPVSKLAMTDAGKVLCIIALCVCAPLFWIGMFLREEALCCDKCGAQLGN